MAAVDIQKFLTLMPTVKDSPQQLVWMSYDTGADTLYVNFKKPSHADDSEMTDDDVIIRYEGKKIVGMTILHASRR